MNFRVEVFSLFLLITLSTNKTFAQYDAFLPVKVYLQDGGQLEGIAMVPLMLAKSKFVPITSNEKLRFKTDIRSRSEYIDSRKIKTVVFSNNNTDSPLKNDLTFIIVPKNKKRTKFGFVKLIVNGRIKLVSKVRMSLGSSQVLPDNSMMTIRNPHNYENLLLLKNDENNGYGLPIKLKGSFKKSAAKFFEDCPNLVKKILNKDFKQKDLIVIVKYYNKNCSN